jgi:hypothetical protein
MRPVRHLHIWPANCAPVARRTQSFRHITELLHRPPKTVGKAPRRHVTSPGFRNHRLPTAGRASGPAATLNTNVGQTWPCQSIPRGRTYGSDMIASKPRAQTSSRLNILTPAGFANKAEKKDRLGKHAGSPRRHTPPANNHQRSSTSGSGRTVDKPRCANGTSPRRLLVTEDAENSPRRVGRA